jgi:hypothetical protein
VIEHVVSHVLARHVERHVEAWVAAGQRMGTTPAPNGQGCVLTFGWRHRLRSALVCCVFGTAFLAFCWWHDSTPKADPRLAVAGFGFILPVFALSVFHALHVGTTRVVLSTDGLVLRRFAMGPLAVAWVEVAEVYRSSVTPAIVLKTRDRRCIRLSTQLSGVGALPEYLQRVPLGAPHRSLVDWVLHLP